MACCVAKYNFANYFRCGSEYLSWFFENIQLLLQFTSLIAIPLVGYWVNARVSAKTELHKRDLLDRYGQLQLALNRNEKELEKRNRLLSIEEEYRQLEISEKRSAQSQISARDLNDRELFIDVFREVFYAVMPFVLMNLREDSANPTKNEQNRSFTRYDRLFSQYGIGAQRTKESLGPREGGLKRDFDDDEYTSDPSTVEDEEYETGEIGSIDNDENLDESSFDETSASTLVYGESNEFERAALSILRLVAVYRLLMDARATRPISKEHGEVLEHLRIRLLSCLRSKGYPGDHLLDDGYVHIINEAMLKKSEATGIVRPLAWHDFMQKRENNPSLDAVFEDITNYIKSLLDETFEGGDTDQRTFRNKKEAYRDRLLKQARLATLLIQTKSAFADDEIRDDWTKFIEEFWRVLDMAYLAEGKSMKHGYPRWYVLEPYDMRDRNKQRIDDFRSWQKKKWKAKQDSASANIALPSANDPKPELPPVPIIEGGPVPMIGEKKRRGILYWFSAK